MIQSYPWYIADWRESETRIKLSLSERALYRELIDYCYLEGSLPIDHVQLSRIAGCSVAEINRHMVAVKPLFVLKEGRLCHAKVDEVRKKLETYHEQKRHAGAKSGQTRRERALNGRSTYVATQDEPSPTPAPEPAPEPSQYAPNGALFDVRPVRQPKRKRSAEEVREGLRRALGERLPWWEEFWATYPCRDGMNPAMEAFERLVTTEDIFRAVMGGAQRYAAKARADPSMRLKYAQGWLNDQRWTDANLIIASQPCVMSASDKRRSEVLSGISALARYRDGGGDQL